jgi:hypothetical protein
MHAPSIANHNCAAKMGQLIVPLWEEAVYHVGGGKVNSTFPLINVLAFSTKRYPTSLPGKQKVWCP